MTNSTKPRDPIFVKEYGFLLFAKNMDRYLSSKYGQKFLDTPNDALKASSKKTLQKMVEAISDLVGNNIVKNIKLVRIQINLHKQQRCLRRYTYHQKNESKLLLSFDYYNSNI